MYIPILSNFMKLTKITSLELSLQLELEPSPKDKLALLLSNTG